MVLEETGWQFTQATMLVISLWMAYIAWIHSYDQLCSNRTCWPDSVRRVISFPLLVMSIGTIIAISGIAAITHTPKMFSHLLEIGIIATTLVTCLAIGVMLLLGALAVILDLAGYFDPATSETQISQ